MGGFILRRSVPHGEVGKEIDVAGHGCGIHHCANLCLIVQKGDKDI